MKESQKGRWKPMRRGYRVASTKKPPGMLEDLKKDGLANTSEAILSVLKSQGLAGKTSLELGCGVGGLTLELVREGIVSGVGIDLSPKMMEAARSLAEQEGLSAKTTFEVGDGASSKLGMTDIVILDTVVCCYPDVAALVENSSSAARAYYAISFPDDRRFATKLLRLFLPITPLLVMIFRRQGFRFFIHPRAVVVDALQKKGFRRVSESRVGWIWSVLVLAAPNAT